MNEIFNIQDLRTELAAPGRPETQEALRALARLIARRLRQEGLAAEAESVQTMAQVS